MALGNNKNRNRYLASKPLKFKQKSNRPMLFPLNTDKTSRNSGRPRKSSGSDFNINLRPILRPLLIILIIFAIGYFAFSRQAMAVLVDGEPVGYIRDVKTTEEELNNLIVAKLKEDVGNNIEINEEITLKKVNSIFKHVSSNAEGVLADVCKAVTYKQEATKILVEGKQMVIVSNIDAAKEVVKRILDNYKLPSGTSDPEIATQIKTESTFVESADVADIDTAVKMLSQTRQEEKIHTVVSGETFATIAANAGMTEGELLEANPSITSETKSNLSVGQKLKIIVTVPTLEMRSYKVETKKVPIPYETEEKPDSSLDRGETQEIQEGVDGEKEVIQKTAYLNGYPENNKSVVETEKVIKKPVTRIIKVGTYEPDYDDDDDDDYEYDEDDDE